MPKNRLIPVNRLIPFMCFFSFCAGARAINPPADGPGEHPRYLFSRFSVFSRLNWSMIWRMHTITSPPAPINPAHRLSVNSDITASANKSSATTFRIKGNLFT
jgi:hypothetical protein